jgi:hypothetical protein
VTGQLVLFEGFRQSPQPATFDSRCLGCRVDTHAIGDYYMLRNEVWVEANPNVAGQLCVSCVERRLGRPLTPTDFTAAPINDPDRHSGPLRARILGAAA